MTTDKEASMHKCSECGVELNENDALKHMVTDHELDPDQETHTNVPYLIPVE